MARGFWRCLTTTRATTCASRWAGVLPRLVRDLGQSVPDPALLRHLTLWVNEIRYTEASARGQISVDCFFMLPKSSKRGSFERCMHKGKSRDSSETSPSSRNQPQGSWRLRPGDFASWTWLWWLCFLNSNFRKSAGMSVCPSAENLFVGTRARSDGCKASDSVEPVKMPFSFIWL